MRQRRSLPLAIAIAILVGACVPRTSVPPDAGLEPSDATEAPPDAGFADADSGADDAGFEDASIEDAMTPDLGLPDTGAVDAGPSFCPGGASPECRAPQDCQDDVSPPTNCSPCTPYNRSLCIAGRCETPALLTANDIYTIVITIAPNVPLVESFAGFVLTEATAGDRNLSCEDFYANRIDLGNDCLNIIDTRAYTLPQTGDTYAVSFGRFASGQRALFVVYGHRGANPTGAPLGVSCTAVDIPPPTGGGPYLISGDSMRILP